MKVTNRQVVNAINTYQYYQNKLRTDVDTLKRELFYAGNEETEKVKKLRQQFKVDSENCSKFLDTEI